MLCPQPFNESPVRISNISFEPRNLLPLIFQEVHSIRKMAPWYEILRNRDRRLQVDDQVPPPTRDVQHFTLAADTFHAALCFARFCVKAEEPFRDT